MTDTPHREVRSEHEQAQEEHATWLEEVERWVAEYEEALEAADPVTLSPELRGHREALPRHAAAIAAHEDVLERHERAIAAEERGVTAASEDYGDVHGLLHTRHEESREEHDRLGQRHRSVMAALLKL